MKVKLLALLFCMIVAFAIPATAQDQGTPDSLIMIATPLEAGVSDATLQIELWGYNNPQNVVIQSGFNWDSDKIELLAAVASPYTASFFQVQVWYDQNIATSNLMNRALFVGISFTGGTFPPVDERYLIATYYFDVVDWDVNSSITFDTGAWDPGSATFFLDGDNKHQPVWSPLVIKDVNAVDCDAPILTCPTPEPYNLCAIEEICLDMPITGADNVTVEGVPGAVWANDQLCFTPDATGIYDLHVVATVDCGEQVVCDVSVDVTIGAPPVIDCPITTAEFNLCAPEQICVPLIITGATDVVTSMGTWANGELCLDATQTDYYEIIVTATNADGCGETVCTVPVNVVMSSLPVVTCPTETIQMTVCSPGQICVDLPITGADNVVVDNGGTWVDGLLCFNATGSDSFHFNVAATNSCGTTNCDFIVDLTVEGTPTIACPTEPVTQFLCDAGEVCLPLEILNAVDITVSNGTYDGANLCFYADTAGTYEIQVDAANNCGTETCNIFVVVEIGAAPAIACPTEPFKFFIQYEAEICVPLAISGAAEISVDGAAYNGASLCFQADTTGTYNFHVVANSDCGEAMCDLSVEVDITPPCVDILLSMDTLYFTAFEGDVTPSPENYTVSVTSSMDSVPFDFTITGMENGMILSATEGTTPAEITIGGDVSLLPIGINEATLTFASTNERVCDPKMNTVVFIVEVFKQPSNDMAALGDLPAVPGLQVAVPISFTNSCFLTEAQIELNWTYGEIFLDSISYVGSALAEFAHSNSIDNDGFIVSLNESAAGVTPVSPSTESHWANLHFTVSPDAVPGTYPIVLNTLQFTRNCGDGPEIEIPEFSPGGILVDVDSTGSYICGWIVTPDGEGYREIENASVEMWSSYPLGEVLMGTTSGHNGAFAFVEFLASVFDIHAYAEGFYPGTKASVVYGDKGFMVVLFPVAELTPTDMWVDYYCESNTLLGLPLPVGSVVEAFDPQGTLCGRQTISEAGILPFMPVYRDSTVSVADEGATTGDIITFKVNGEEALATGDVFYPASYMQIEVCLSAGATLTKTCDLMAGWNLISWNLNTESDNVEDLLMDHMDCIDVILGFEQGGLTYDPDLPQFSTLWNMDHFSGYWVKVADDCGFTLELEGLPVLASTPITVTQGWNLVSYLADGPLAPIEALASVHDNLDIAYGSDQGIEIYKPGQDQFNNLAEMNSCLGYWIKVSMDDLLIYPSGGPIPATPEIDPLIAELARLAPIDVAPTTNWMNLYSTELTIDGEKVQAGADIAAYTLDNKKIGGFRVTSEGEFGFMPVYADDAGNQGVNGMLPGDKFYIAIDGEESNETFTWTTTGDRLEINLLTSKGTSTGTLPDNYLLGQNYPNPFNPTTSISFTLPASSQAKIEIYNVLGKLVAVPFDGIANAGENTVEWNGKLMNGSRASSGVYFYRLSSDSFTETKKMMLLK